MAYNCVAFVTGAAQRPPKIVKFDFFAIHGITTCHALMVVLEQPWITREIKIRLVEWMGRIIITVYASSGCPQLLPEEIKEYQPEAKYETEEHAWQELKKRALDVNDDGHTSKVVRGLLHGKMVSKKYERGDPRFPVQGDMWLKLCHMCESLIPSYMSLLCGFRANLHYRPGFSRGCRNEVDTLSGFP